MKNLDKHPPTIRSGPVDRCGQTFAHQHHKACEWCAWMTPVCCMCPMHNGTAAKEPHVWSHLREQAALSLAFPVDDLEVARTFWTCLGVKRACRSEMGGFDFFGHQLSARCENPSQRRRPKIWSTVTVFKCGILVSFTMGSMEDLRALPQEHGAHFVIEPKVRFQGKPGEQATMFVQGPSGNVLGLRLFAARRMFCKMILVGNGRVGRG